MDSARRLLKLHGVMSEHEGSDLEREGVGFLFRAWGLEAENARRLLRTAGFDLQVASDAWIDAGAELAVHEVPRETRLAIALRFAQERRREL